ncbi:GNAT family protein [Mammaliicoccus sp. Dog046]|uniref:GNAT family N-acetyltransferase n=1 Tax=Mammaliicoccus sp. Dog046 TaxID=3034233 RepID=UPI002B25B072|nr:GNAT family protein [Mammaliicoccus sp. Dog046]WQK84882.1 GNAT family protein [Mammaliicoccus sp. Dog046]
MHKVSDNLYLSELSESDLKEYYYWKYIDAEQQAKKWNGPYIKEETYSFEQFKRNYNTNKFLYNHVHSCLAIKYKDEFIGVVTAYWKDPYSKWIECGIVIYKNNNWEKGLGSQIFSDWIDHLFTNTDTNRIGISTWSGNIRMIKVANKIGMVEEARIRQGRIVRGQSYDAIQMGILKEEWQEG